MPASRVANNTADYFKILDKNISCDGLFPEMDLNNFDDTIILMQDGYLIVGSIIEIFYKQYYNIKEPNNEIKDSIRLGLLADFFVPANT
ncbi:MAG: hypothetical protein LBQ12_04140 [Deltaproteobacteria bacterium]|nr:hypothetical protein [Deltaproteobacteria bacterium]